MLVARERARIVDKVLVNFEYGCYSRVERELKIPRASARYWLLKFLDQHFHESPCGGKRLPPLKILRSLLSTNMWQNFVCFSSFKFAGHL